MSNKSDSILGNDTICDALECHKTATENINLSAGKFGIIDLKVCKECSKLFIQSQENIKYSDCSSSPAKVQSD